MSLTPNAAATPPVASNAIFSTAMSTALTARQRDSVSGDSSLLVSPHKSNLQHHQQHHNNQPPQNVANAVTSDHHPILRVASAHGSRDCVNLLPYHAAIGQHKIQQRALFHNVSSSNALNTGTVQMSRSNMNVPATSVPSSVQMQQPPLYQQAVQDFTKFGPPFRRSPESRAIQAVQPFGLVGSVGSNSASDALPTIIPKECQVVKQLVREVVASQLANQGAAMTSCNAVANNKPQFFAPHNPGSVQENIVAAGPADPPPYSATQQRTITEQSSQQERRLPPAEASERSTILYQNYAHDLTTPKSASIEDPSIITTPRQQQQSALATAPLPRNIQQMQQLINVNNNYMGSLRMSLSHSDLSRLQHLSLAPEVQPQVSKMHPLLAAQQQNSRPPNVDIFFRPKCKRKNSLTLRCEQLQQEVNTLREAVQKRDELYKRNTTQLQKEIAQLRVLKKENKKSSSNDLEDISVAKLKRELQEKENQMYNFQQESERWQKLYNDEIQRKETTMGELSEAKNARIKSLEEMNAKTEKKMEDLENK
uniref:Angiomotin C-terminal domain-containing protein n=1 Tax=Romanomermis culicivorax TaxID=13658 RepID=A0A915LAG6_ROMCU